MGVVLLGRPEVAEVIGDRLFRPGVVESIAYETPVHPSGDRMKALWVARGRIIHYRIPVELRVPVRNSVCVHELHSLNGDNL